jgi:AraC family transcriptional regulator
MQAYHVKAILEVLVHIEAHIDESLLLSDLAKIAHISPYYFLRLFKAYLSMTPRAYIKQIRFVQSAKRLQYSQIPITEIAFSMGYEDLSSFTRAFLQSAKKSPSAYRKERQAQLLHLQAQEESLKPEYLYREEETVRFLRKTGDYRETVIEGINECCQLFRGMQRCYGMALDDPLTISRKNCRFDVCVLNTPHAPNQGYWGQKKIPGGRYLVFTHCGPFLTLEETFTRCFYLWHQKEKLRFSSSFCEYIDLPEINEFNANTRITAKYYVPLIR